MLVLAITLGASIIIRLLNMIRNNFGPRTKDKINVRELSVAEQTQNKQHSLKAQWVIIVLLVHHKNTKQ